MENCCMGTLQARSLCALLQNVGSGSFSRSGRMGARRSDGGAPAWYAGLLSGRMH